jgi:hypothetical protein
MERFFGFLPCYGIKLKDENELKLLKTGSGDDIISYNLAYIEYVLQRQRRKDLEIYEFPHTKIEIYRLGGG